MCKTLLSNANTNGEDDQGGVQDGYESRDSFEEKKKINGIFH